MAELGKTVAFCVAALLLLGMFIVDRSSAQTKPSVPQFTLSTQDNAVVLTIQNQPFDAQSGNSTFFYDVRVMTAGNYWASFHKPTEEYERQSESEVTIFTYPIGKSSLFPQLTTVGGIPIPTSGEATFQVNALVGTLQKSYAYPDGSYSLGLVGKVSGWSSSQTIKLPSNLSIPISYVSPTGGMSTHHELTLFSPDEQSTYDGILPLQFMISWNYDLIPIFEPNTSYAYSIDGNPFVGITANKTSMDGPGHGYTFVYNPSFSYMIDVSNLTDGHHEIAIRTIFDFGHTLLNDTSTSFSFNVKNSNPHIATPTSKPTEPSTATTSANASTSPTPTVPEFPCVIPLVAVLAAVTALLVLVRKAFPRKP
jgi:hypothetical protein